MSRPVKALKGQISKGIAAIVNGPRSDGKETVFNTVATLGALLP